MDLPFLLHDQQAHWLTPSEFSVKLTSSFGLWWWQKGQEYAWFPLAVRLPVPKTELTKLTSNSFTMYVKIQY